MALTIRLQRCGSKNNPHFRLVVAERSIRRDGKSVEMLGHYAPRDPVATRYLNIDLARADYWLKVGAQPSDTVRNLIKLARKSAAPAA
jgi:small subunit ribosomal protein S16